MSLSATGTLRLWKEGDLEINYVELIKSLRGHGGGQINDAASLPNGAFVTVGVDTNIQIWEEKIGGDSCVGSCCALF